MDHLLFLPVLFSVLALFRELGGIINYDGDFLVFESNHFRNGFMYKQFGMNAIVNNNNNDNDNNNNTFYNPLSLLIFLFRYLKV